MALRQYRIPVFYGIAQNVTENRQNDGESPDACNMDTQGGRLSVAKGYVRESDISFPSASLIKRLYVWRRAEERKLIVTTASQVYVLDEVTNEWRSIYDFGAEATAAQYDFLPVKIASTEYLLIASAAARMAKWDGVSEAAEAFGSEEGLSNIAVNYVELYYSRLFAAGDAGNPGRLYYSQAPGDTRSLESWASAQESENVGGGFVDVGTDSDPITGLFALSNQLLIFKRDSLYRLLGDRPGNFRIQPVNGTMQQPVHTACVRAGDVLYFLTAGGMYYFDGQTVQRKADADKVRVLLERTNLIACIATASSDRLYFTIHEAQGEGANDAILIYDLARGTYMLRRGFTANGFFAAGGTLYLVDGNGFVCRFEEGETYDGVRIDAYWKTPMTDLDSKAVGKRLEELYLRGSGGILSVEAVTESGTVYNERLMPGGSERILELGLTGEGRAFQLVFRNVNGSHFTIDGGVELIMDMQRRVL
ncbi:MAG: hypothetical protein PHW41_04180 [Eubacteriales bacterium]|nr:hypothetical protein [Eubacteriales bacterium]